MRTMTFIVTLESDAVISETSATAGVHSTLDYLPGAALLGACAASLYGSLAPEESFLVFHSGRVRFGNAYPLAENGAPAIPVPAAWHSFKGESPVAEKKIGAGVINQLHYAMTREDELKQPKQIREGYFTLCGHAPKVKKGYRLKTAVDRAQKRAAESQLFGYGYLSADSRWWFQLICDDDIDSSLIQKIQTAISGSIRLGRSRTAEFGQAFVHAADGTFKIPSNLTETGLATLYCLSDLALRDSETGIPTLIPSGQHFGLTDVELDKGRSFIRTRSYAPFNSTRRSNDLERQVITKGSIISFRKKSGGQFTAQELAALSARIENGAGHYQQDGLGRVSLNPAFLEGPGFSAAASTFIAQPTADKKTTSFTSELTEWLYEKMASSETDKSIIEQVEKWAATLKNAIKSSENYPGNSQWGTIRSVSGTKAEIERLLFSIEKGKEGFCCHGVSKEQWQAEFRLDNSWISFADFLKEKVLASFSDDASACKALQLLGNRMPRILNQMKGGKNDV